MEQHERTEHTGVPKQLNWWSQFKFRHSGLFRAEVSMETADAQLQAAMLRGDSAGEISFTFIRPAVCSLINAQVEIAKSLNFWPKPRFEKEPDDDLTLFTKAHAIIDQECGLVRISGVDLAAAPEKEIPPHPGDPKILVEAIRTMGKKKINQMTWRGMVPIPQLFAQVGAAVWQLIKEGEVALSAASVEKAAEELARARKTLTERHRW